MFGLFITRGFKDYVKAVQEMLRSNWTCAYTRPSPGLYPHQWNWDSAFIAIGHAHYNQKKAQQELKSLFAHQWPNGMVPQIVFNPKVLGHYFPDTSWISSGAWATGKKRFAGNALSWIEFYYCFSFSLNIQTHYFQIFPNGIKIRCNYPSMLD